MSKVKVLPLSRNETCILHLMTMFSSSIVCSCAVFIFRFFVTLFINPSNIFIITVFIVQIKCLYIIFLASAGCFSLHYYTVHLRFILSKKFFFFNENLIDQVLIFIIFILKKLAVASWSIPDTYHE